MSKLSEEYIYLRSCVNELQRRAERIDRKLLTGGGAYTPLGEIARVDTALVRLSERVAAYEGALDRLASELNIATHKYPKPAEDMVADANDIINEFLNS